MTQTLMTQTLKRISFSFVLVLAMAGLTGCAVGPNYKRPAVDVPGMYRGSTADMPVTADAKPQPGKPGQAKAEQATESLGDAKWWEVFQDPQLQSLIRTALKNNYDDRIAATRVLQAQAHPGISPADQHPSFSA